MSSSPAEPAAADPTAPGTGDAEAPETGLLAGIERAVLSTLLGSMLALAGVQIVLRNVFDTGLPWADPLLRAMLLWLGLLGALAASRRDKQVRVDALPRLLPPRARLVAAALTGAFTALVAGAVAWHAGRFVATERAYASEVFAGIPGWWLQLVIPIAFGGMALFHLRHALVALRDFWRSPPESPS